MTKNKESTRYYSELQEKHVADILNGIRTSNSGAGLFKKGDIIQKDASLLIECKTCTSNKESFSIKKEWLDKNNNERKLMRLDNSARMNYPGTVGSPNWEWKLKDHNWTKRIKYPDYKWFK